MNWTKFQALSREFRSMQLVLLKSATPEAMDLRGLVAWGKLLRSAIAYSYKVEADSAQPPDTRSHWGELKTHAVLQLERTAATVRDYIETADELSSWERCQIFDLLSLCSQTFQTESELLLLQANDSCAEAPASVSSETLAKLASWL